MEQLRWMSRRNRKRGTQTLAEKWIAWVHAIDIAVNIAQQYKNQQRRTTETSALHHVAL